VIPVWLVLVAVLCISYLKATFEEPGSPTYITGPPIMAENISYGDHVEELKAYSRKEAE
jgi:hypothetical protein